MKVAYIGTCESDPAMEASEPMSENGWNCSKASLTTSYGAESCSAKRLIKLELMVGSESRAEELALRLVLAFLLRCHSAILDTNSLTCCFTSGGHSATCGRELSRST